MSDPLSMIETWEVTVGVDTPQYQEKLRAALGEAQHMQKTAAQLLALAQASVKASEAAALARRELGQALAVAGGDAFAQAELSAAAASAGDGAAPAAPMSTKGLTEIFSQLEVAEAMQVRQVQSLLIEPLQALLEEPRGLGSVSKLAQQYGTHTHELYEALNEFLALEGDGASAAAAKAHAKTTAKATAKAGAAVMSSVSSKLGAGLSLFGRKLNQQLTSVGNELGTTFRENFGGSAGGGSGASPTAASPAAAAVDEELDVTDDGVSSSSPTSSAALSDAADRKLGDAFAELRSGSSTLHETQAAVHRHQVGVLRTRHALEARLVEAGAGGRIGLGKMLVDYFYARFSFAHQQASLLDRHEAQMRTMQVSVEDARGHLENETGARLRLAAHQVGKLCEALGGAPTPAAPPPPPSPGAAPPAPATSAPPRAAAAAAATWPCRGRW